MNISELVGSKLPEIKKLLFSETEEKFEDAKLVDGTIVRYEVLEIGAALSVVGEDGEIVAAPDGEHELESGVVVRTEGGLIVEILEPEAEPVEEEAGDEEKEEEMSADETTEETTEEATEEVVEEVAQFDAEAFKLDIMDSVATLIQAEVDKFAKTEKVGEIEKAVGLITDIVEKMAATPKEEPTKKVPNPFNKGTNYAEIAEKMRAAITKK
jgi:hypothetical protein